jgi:hypothetical protein
MRVLLDECLPRRLKAYIHGHDVRTVPEVGWAGTKDRELLWLAEGQFDTFVTVDRSLAFQQNLVLHRLAIIQVMTRSNRFDDLLLFVEEIQQAVDAGKPGTTTRVPAA